MSVIVPQAFARATIAREGEPGKAWIGRLPTIVDDLLTRWTCELDGPASHGGVALVVPVKRRAEAAVMKVSFTHPGNVHEPYALHAWGGVGAVRLLERDDQQYAMLLERLSASTLASLSDTDQVMLIAGDLSKRLGIAAPLACPALRTQLSAWRGDIERGRAQRPDVFDKQVVLAALDTIDTSVPDEGDVLIHGDLHAANILHSERAGWLAIDPKGYVGDRAFDAGMVVKWMAVRMLEGAPEPIYDDAAVSRALDVYAEAAELDRNRVRAWAQVHALQGAYWTRFHGILRARGGPDRDRAVEYLDHLAVLLMDL